MILEEILKKIFNKNLDDFLKITQKLSDKKRQLINISQRKLSNDKEKLKIVVISFLNNLSKENLSVSILPRTFDKDVVHIAIISIDAYCLLCKLKKIWVFIVFIKVLEFEAIKEIRPETNSKGVVPEEYSNLLNVFSKKDSDILFLY